MSEAEENNRMVTEIFDRYRMHIDENDPVFILVHLNRMMLRQVVGDLQAVADKIANQPAPSKASAPSAIDVQNLADTSIQKEIEQFSKAIIWQVRDAARTAVRNAFEQQFSEEIHAEVNNIKLASRQLRQIVALTKDSKLLVASIAGSSLAIGVALGTVLPYFLR